MRLRIDGSPFRTAKPMLALLAIAASACVANAQPTGFEEDFAGPGLDVAWEQGGDIAGHPSAIAGSYDMTDVRDPEGEQQMGVKLSRLTPGTLSSYTHEIEVVLDPFLLFGSGGTLSDFKWKSFGPDGFMEVVINSFGNMRLFHNDSNDTVDGGNLAGGFPDNINIGYADGDLLKLTTVYDTNSDTIDVTYSLNGGAAQAFYSGGGISGPIGDLITSFVEVEVFKFGDAEPTQATAAIDNWSLAASTNGTPGDFDGDGDVDGTDFLNWQRGDSPQGGTPAELIQWEANYGAPPLAAVTAGVPEPSGILLVFSSAAVLGLSRGLRR